jgi:hypothetical protein
MAATSSTTGLSITGTATGKKYTWVCFGA